MTKRKRRGIAVLISGILAGGSTLAVAGDGDTLPDRLSGLLNDYTPASVSGGPYEMRGEWSLDLHGRSGTADFSAAMNMETSDWGVSKGIVDPNVPTTRGAHTHHITMVDAAVSLDTSGCPTFSPATSGGFVVTGPANVTGNGSPAPFQSGGKPLSTIQLCITGGSMVALSNLTLTFTGGATGHFGTYAIHGVVTCTEPNRDPKQELCGDGRDGWSYGDGSDGGGSHRH
ncbi:MAG TPA: hypothetical protein VF405_04305 [Gammaproteobacteria bacterium]